MIFVDKAVGSADLEPMLRKTGVPVELAWIGTADVEFMGRGVNGDPVLIGIEVKRLTELTGDWDRFAGVQVPKMQAPTYAHRWLIYEGEWTKDKRSGLLTRWAGKRGRKPLHGQANALALRKKLLTLEMCAGFHKERTYDRAETVEAIVALYRFWTDDDLDKHKSHIVNYQPIGLLPLSKFAHAFGAWPDISVKRAKAVARKFKNSIRRASSASVDEWAALEVPDEEGNVRHLGAKTAEKLVRFLNGEE